MVRDLEYQDKQITGKRREYFPGREINPLKFQKNFAIVQTCITFASKYCGVEQW